MAFAAGLEPGLRTGIALMSPLACDLIQPLFEAVFLHGPFLLSNAG
jgi:hypothetical protein